jgi:transposase
MKKKLTVTQIGLDVHRKFSLASGRDGRTQQIVWRERLEHADRDQLRARLSRWPQGVAVVLEGTFGWGWMSDELLAAGLDPHLSSSRKTASWRKERGQAKSNRIDADLLSELWDQKPTMIGGVMRRWWEVWLAPPEVRDQRELLRHRMSLVRMQTMVKNQVHALLHRHGIMHSFSDLFGANGRRWLSLLVCDEQRLRSTARQTLKDQLIFLDTLRRLIARATVQFRRELKRLPAGERLITLPGVSTVLAYTIVAEIGRIERFAKADHLVRYSLLAPEADDSGEEDQGKPIGRRIGHAGRATLQWAWIEAAHSAVRRDPRMRERFNRRTDQGTRDRGRGYITVANQLCRIGYSMWKHQRDYVQDAPARPGSGKPGSGKKVQSSNTPSGVLQQPVSSGNGPALAPYGPVRLVST